MLLLIFCLVVNAIQIPETISMKDMKKSDPSKSAPTMIAYYVLSYKWYITGVFFVLVCLAMIITISKSFSSKSEEVIEDEEEIYLEGRKLLLPSSEIFKCGEKFHLSEEFEEKDKKKDPKGIYKDTLITKLKLSYANQ